MLVRGSLDLQPSSADPGPLLSKGQEGDCITVRWTYDRLCMMVLPTVVGDTGCDERDSRSSRVWLGGRGLEHTEGGWEHLAAQALVALCRGRKAGKGLVSMLLG